METSSHSLVVSELLLAKCRKARKVPWLWLFCMALVRI
jgi:hypothetical protein